MSFTGFPALNRLLQRLAPAKTPGNGSGAGGGLQPLGDPPENLIRAVRERRCVLFGGEELSKQSGMPLWSKFLLGLCDYMADTRVIDRDDCDRLRAIHRDGAYTHLVRILKTVTADTPEVLTDYAAKLYSKRAPLSLVHEALRTVPFCGAVTGNLDNILERVLIPDTVYTPATGNDALDAAKQSRLFVMKLRGDLRHPEMVCVWPDTAARNVPGTCADLFSWLLSERTLLFLGASLDEIENWLGSIPPVLQAGPHYAVIAKPDDDSAAKVRSLQAKLRLEVLHMESDSLLPLAEFVKKLQPPQE